MNERSINVSESYGTEPGSSMSDTEEEQELDIDAVAEAIAVNAEDSTPEDDSEPDADERDEVFQSSLHSTASYLYVFHCYTTYMSHKKVSNVNKCNAFLG